MINRDKCENLIIETVEANAGKRAFRRIITTTMTQDHGVMKGKTLQLIGNKEHLKAASVEELLWLCDAISLALDGSVSFKEFFTPNEVGMYRNSKTKREDESAYPVVFKNVLQINNDQWVTTINIDELYDLYKKQLINYNKNTQRPTRRREVNGLVEYKISVNKRSIREITQLMRDHLFIPNALTFNINIDNVENSFTYSNGRLELLSGVFDIIDGFHRYKSLIDCKIENPAFNYNMVLNIMNFTEEKAGTYIAQEDKRNKISKSVVKTMDANNPVNFIIQRLNDDGGSYLRGEIGRTGNYSVNSAWLFEAISKCYKVEDNRDGIALVRYLREAFNAVIEDGTFEKTFLGVAVVVIASSMYRETEDISKIKAIVKASKYLPEEIKKETTVTKKLITEVEKLERWG